MIVTTPLVGLTLHTLVVVGTEYVTGLPDAPPVAETEKVPPALKTTGPGLAPKLMVCVA